MDTAGFQAIKAERVTDTIYRRLRESIIGQALAPGSKVHVDELAHSFGVSRTPVHEALTMLAADGLVEVVPRRGTFVSEYSSRDIAETLDIRRALELLACETAAERAGPEDLNAMAQLVDDMQRAVRDAASPEEAARAHDAKNLEFHRRLVQLSGNQRLIATYEDLRAHLRIARAHVNAGAWRQRVPHETKEHQEILDALRARDPDAIKRALDAHLRRASASLIADLGDGRGGPRERVPSNRHP